MVEEPSSFHILVMKILKALIIKIFLMRSNMVAIGLGKIQFFTHLLNSACVGKFLCGELPTTKKKTIFAIFGTEFKLNSVPCYYVVYDVDVGLLNYRKYV